jgi:hypothetical protein
MGKKKVLKNLYILGALTPWKDGRCRYQESKVCLHAVQLYIQIKTNFPETQD